MISLEGSKNPVTSKMELFVEIVNGCKPSANVTKSSVLVL